MRVARVMAMIAAAGATAGALADNVLQVDVDALSAEASGTFSESFTGDLHVFNTATDADLNGNAEILDVLIDGTAQSTGGAGVGDFAFDMTISFAAGKITDGSLTLAVDQSGSENSYTADIAPTSGVAILDIGGIFLIGGLTFDGLFDAPLGTFLGVDVSTWGSVQPVSGSFSQIAFEPDAGNADADTDVDVFIAVPTPAAAGMASVGFLTLLGRRRRL